MPLKVGIIGAGRVGCSLALALARKGAEITGVYSRSAEWVGFLGRELGREYGNDMESVLRDAEVVFLCVTDTQLPDMAKQVAEACPRDISGKVFLHCSGALTSDVLEPLRGAGGHTGSLHPIQTFPDRETGWKGMFGIFFGFEGDPCAGESAASIASLLQGELLTLKKEGKPLYHAAACVLSNYMVILAHTAGRLLEQAGIPAEEGLRAFRPLLENTVRNIAGMGSVKALTGPVSRGDTGVVAEHLQAMKNAQAIGTLDPEAEELYRILGRATVELAREKGSIDREKAGELEKLLKE